MKITTANVTMPSTKHPELEKLILRNSTRICIPSKTVFNSPGDHLDSIYYIVNGRTRHYMQNAEGIEKTLYVLTGGWFFGETAYFTYKATGLFSMAEQNTELCIINSDDIQAMLASSRLFRDKLMECASLKMLMARYEVENLAFNSSKVRLKRLLCAVSDTDLLEDGWYNLKIKYTHYEMGVLVGSSRVTISKMINTLCNEKFIRIINRSIQVNAEEYKRFCFESGKD